MQAYTTASAYLSLAARKQGIPTPRVWVYPSTHHNASKISLPFFSCILVSDGLIHDASPREVEAILLHELGHIAHDGPYAAGIITAIAALDYIYQHTQGIPWLCDLYACITILMLAVALLYARRQSEYMADAFAAHHVSDIHALITSIQHYGDTQIGALHHIPWLHTHPPVQARIASIQQRIHPMDTYTPLMDTLHPPH